MTNRLTFLVACALGACTFSKDIPEPIVPDVFVGFHDRTSTADEKDKMFPVLVELSDPTTVDVVVGYQIEPGPGVEASDFKLLAAEVVIPAGEKTAPLYFDIATDTMEEGDEHLDITLVEPTNAQLLIGAEKHDLTIRAKALPRVSFEQATSQAQEPTDVTFNAKLDEASAFDITATYTVTSPNAVNGSDFVLAAGEVTFTAGQTVAPIVLDVLDDALDEDNESVVVTFTEATNAVVDTAIATHTHTILDDLVDPPPTVQFTSAASSFDEGAGALLIPVVLSAPSGRTITVPYAVAAASTAGGADYTIAAGPLTFAPGTTAAQIAVTITQDTADEPSETIILDLGAATNATNAGVQQHRITVDDDDQICYGTAPYLVCLDAPPTGTASLNGLVDTNGASCATLQPSTWTTAPQSQPAACFILRDTISVGNIVVTGSRPLVLLAHTGITVGGRADIAAGVNPADCAAFQAVPGNSSSGGGGGAGGSFMTAGGDGGSGDGNNTTAGGAAAAAGTPTKLRGGCAGQRGGSGSNGAGSNQAGNPGRGGGAIYLVTAGTLSLEAAATLNASGGGGAGGAVLSGGSGGGSGGMIRLHAGTLVGTAGAKIVANGGGGASGADTMSAGGPGNDPDPATPGTPAGGGTGGGASGGAGRAGTTNADKGDDANSNEGGGGGGGGGGLVQSNVTLTNVTTSAGVIQQP